MAVTPTTQIQLGFKAPKFSLPNVLTNKNVSFDDLKGEKATLVMFICNHCPFVIHVINELVKLANDYKQKGIKFIAINSNDVINYPDDSPEKMIEFIAKYNIPFPYLFDETQEVAKAYDAACTPDFSVFDKNDTCIYRGQLDDSRPGNTIPVTGNSLREVFDNILNNQEVSKNQKPSIGCNIKWKN